MTGSDIGLLMLAFVTVIAFLLGIIVLAAGAVISVFSFQWWIFAVAGILFLAAGAGWYRFKLNERRYFENIAECEKSMQEYRQEEKG